MADGVNRRLHRAVYVTQRAPVHQEAARAACPDQIELVMLVSPSTAEIIDAVADAYRTGRLGGVATDGFAWEPVRPDNPLIDLASDRRANVVLTPHSAQAGLVIDVDVRRAEYTNLLAVIENRPLLHRVA